MRRGGAMGTSRPTAMPHEGGGAAAGRTRGAHGDGARAVRTATGPHHGARAVCAVTGYGWGHAKPREWEAGPRGGVGKGERVVDEAGLEPATFRSRS